ncbi:MAG TPA: phage capsid protein [Akkermansia muciniphila]|nr:phage capsid protein [Akkermansia muciniphila]
MEFNLSIADMLRTKYSSIFEREIQQVTSILEPYCSVLPGRGKDMEIPYVGKTEFKEIGNRFVEASPHELSMGKRVIKPLRYADSLHKDDVDNILLNDLELSISDFIAEMKKAGKRLLDQVLLGVVPDKDNPGKFRIRTTSDSVCGGMLAPNYTGNSGATLTDLDPNLVVPADFKMDGTKNPAGFLLDQIVEAKRMLEENYAWDEASGDTLCLAISSTMKAQMIMWEEQKNKNYGFSVLEHGKVNPMLNVRFLVTNMLPFDEDGNRICPMWVKSRLVLSPWDQMKFSIVRPDKYQNLSVVRADAACMYGASRKDEKSFVQILCKKKATAGS